jgi:hypothetical protein
MAYCSISFSGVSNNDKKIFMFKISLEAFNQFL